MFRSTESTRRDNMTPSRTQEDARITNFLNERVALGIKSVFDLVNSRRAYPEAIPVLLECLALAKEPWIKEGVVRALTVKEARGKAETALVTEFRAVPPNPKANLGLKWTIGNALSIVATDAVFSDLVDLLKDKQNGRSREMLAVALGNMKNPAAVDVLINLLNDDEIAGHALMGLAKLKAQKSRPYIERFLNHPKPWVRKEASKAFAKLNK